MEDREDMGKPQDDVHEEEEVSEEEVPSLESSENMEEEKQTQFEEVESMEEKAQVEVTEEKKSGGKGLVYLALIFAIVALVLSFWNAGVQRVVKEIENQEKMLVSRTNSLVSKTNALENTVNRVKAQALLSQIQLEASKVYFLTMGEKNYEGAAKVLAAMESRINALKAYYPQGVDELMALVDALKKEVAKGPSPIPGLVAQIQSVSDKMMGVKEVAAVATAPVEEVKPAKVEEKGEKAEEKEAVQAPAKAEEKKETVIKKAPAPKEEVAPAGPQAGKAPEEEGPFGGLLKSWSKLGEKLVGKK